MVRPAVMNCGEESPATPAIVDDTNTETITQANTEAGPEAEVSTTHPDADEGATEEKEEEAGQKQKSKPDFKLSAFPNPVVDQLNFGWTADADGYVQLELVDTRGGRVAELFSGPVREGEHYHVAWPANHLRESLYIYHYSSGTRTVHGKVLKQP